MRTQSIFQILLGIACLGLSVTANVFWPFAHISYLVGFFASSLYVVCGWASYRVSTDNSKVSAEIGVALCLTLVSIAADLCLLVQYTNNITAFLTQFLNLEVDWYEGDNLLFRGKGVLVCALDIPVVALCFIHLLTAAVCVKKLKFMIYARDEESMIGAYIRNPSSLPLAVNPLHIPRAWSYGDRRQDPTIEAIVSSPYMARPHPLYPPVGHRQPGEGLPRIPLNHALTPKEQHHAER